MERYTLDRDIKVFYVTADSFPDGIGAAYQKLHALVPSLQRRIQFGLSAPEHGRIVYKAAMEEAYPGEAEKPGCENFVIRKGEYISIMIHDFMKDLPAIGKAFQELIAYPDIDPQGVCVEWYLNEKDVRCMVRLR